MSEEREWRDCRVCGKRAPVESSGRFPEHRIYRTRCPGSGQFVVRWDEQRERRAVEQVARRWSA